MSKKIEKLEKLEDLYVEIHREGEEVKRKLSEVKVKFQSLIGKNTYTGEKLTVSFVPGKTSDKISITEVRKNEKIYKKLKNIGLIKDKLINDQYRYKVKV